MKDYLEPLLDGQTLLDDLRQLEDALGRSRRRNWTQELEVSPRQTEAQQAKAQQAEAQRAEAQRAEAQRAEAQQAKAQSQQTEEAPAVENPAANLWPLSSGKTAQQEPEFPLLRELRTAEHIHAQTNILSQQLLQSQENLAATTIGQLTTQRSGWTRSGAMHLVQLQPPAIPSTADNAGWAPLSNSPTPRWGSQRLDYTREFEQAETVDRVFRRDSRRYDSGFFLY